MKIKTFILTFLLMSCPFLFGQHWTDPGNLGFEDNMRVTAYITLDGNVQQGSYQVAAFHENTLLDVNSIVAKSLNGSEFYHVDMEVPGETTFGNIYFKFYNGTNEYVSLEVPFTDLFGTHANIASIEFKSVAQIGDVVYSTLQDAVNACTTGDNTITLLADVSDDVTIKQVENVNVLINGNEKQYSGTFTIHGNARYEGAETLTFTNINFVTSEASHYFIDSNSTESEKRYAHNVTVDDCTFTATGAAENTAAAMRIRQGYDIAINGSTFNGLHSALQAYGNKGITVTGITLDGKNGISAGTSSNVTISGSNINATGYGVRADGDGAYNMTLAGNTITAELPVVVRKTDGAYNLTVQSGSYIASNEKGAAVTFTTGDDGTFVAPTSDATATLAEGITYFGFEAKVNNVYHTTFANAYAAAENGDALTLLKDFNFDTVVKIEKAITLDLNNNTVTSTARKAFEVYANATIKNGTIIAKERAVDTRKNVELALNNVSLSTTGSGNTQPLTIGGDVNGTKVTLTKVNINAGNAGYGIITFVKTTLTADADTEISGYSALYVKDGSEGSEFTFNGSTLSGTIGNDVEGNSFSTIAIQEDGVKVTVNNGTINATGTNYAALSIGYSEQPINENNNVTLDAEINGNILETNCLDKNTVIVRDDYKTVLEGLGYATSPAGTGLVKVEGVAVAMIGTTPYASITAAIKAATAGQTITLLKDVTENFTISKNLTIDGAGKNYTGTMTGNAGLTVTIQNVKFVNAGFSKTTKSTTGNYTFTNCTFDGNGTYAYPIIVKGANTITVENCTVNNYQYSFLYVTSATPMVTVKNVTVENCPNYAVYFASGVTNGTIEKLTVKNSNNGILFNNTANRALTLKDCKFENVGTAINHAGNGTNTITCNLNGVNDFGGAALSPYVKIVAEAQIGNKFYGDLNDALAAAQTGETVYIFAGEEAYDQELTINKAITVEGKNGQAQFTKLNITADGATAKNIYTYNPAGDAEGAYINAKDVTIEGCSIQGGWGGLYQSYTSGTVTFKNSYIGGGVYGIHFDGNNGGNIVIDNCEVAGWTSFAKTITTVAITDTEFIEAGYNQLRFYQNAQLDGCTFNANMTIDFGTNDVDADFTNCTVKDGASLTDVIYLGDIVEMGVDVTINGEPLIVEAKVADADGKNAEYYLTLAEAINAATENQVVTVCADVELENTLTIAAGKVVTLDLNGKVVSGVSATAGTTAVITNKGNLTVKSSVEGGKITTNALYPDTNWGSEGFPSYANNTVRNEGTFTLVSGTIENTSAAGGATYAIDNYNGSTTNINGGLVVCENNIAIRLFCGDNIALNVNDGEVKGTRALWIQLASSTASVAPNVDVNIEGGTLTATGNGEYKLAIYSYSYGNNMQNVEINISGGTFNGDIALTGGENKDKVETLNITGGTFNGKDGDVYSYGDDAKAIEAITIKGGTFKTNAAEKYAEDDNFIFVENAEGTYNVTAGTYVAAINGERYSSVANAITAAQAGETITLLKDVKEDVTVGKNITIDGDNNNYTGNISVKGNANSTVVTVKNVNFVDYEGYAITTNTIKSITVENCTVDNYGFGFLYANKTTPTVVVKNVTVNGGNYGMHWVYGTKATLENVTMTNVANGLYIQNYASKTINVKNSTISSIAIWERDGKSGVQTFKFEGNNTVGTLSASQYAKYVLTAEGTTLTAPEGATVTTTVEDCSVKYLDGAYKLVPNVASIGEVTYASIQEAINAAQDNETVVLLQSVTLADANMIKNEGNRDVMLNVAEKDITLDLNGQTINVDYNGGQYLYAVVCVEDGAGLTVTGNGTIDIAENGINVAYMFWKRGTTGHLTIKNGSFHMDDSGDSMIYANSSNTTIVEGGNFIIDNVATRSNGFPCIISAAGQNQNNILIKGGTYNYDINHQYWAFEVNVPETLALRNNNNDTWTVVPAEAYVVEQFHNYKREVGYETLEEAFAVAMAKDYTNVVLVKDVELENTLTVAAGEEVVLDLKGKTISQEKECTDSYSMFTNKGKLTIIGNGTINFKDLSKGGSSSWGSYVITNNGELIVENGTIEHLGSADNDFDTNLPIQNYAGKVTINGGTIKSTQFRSLRDFTAGGEIVINGGKFIGQVWMQGLGNGSSSLTINGGEFEPQANDGSSVFITNGTNVVNVSITGGTFATKIGATNPAKEGVAGCITGGTFTTTAKENTNAALVNGNYSFVENVDGTWTVKPTQKQHLVKGWNWYSSYLNIQGPTGFEKLTTALGANASTIKSQDNGSTDYYGGSWYGGLDEISPSQMYKINASEACELNISESVVNPEEHIIKLKATGWSWIGYPSNVGVDINVAFADLHPADGDVIKTQNDGSADFAFGQWWGSLSTMVPGIGYQYRNAAGEVREFTYNIEVTRAATKANVTSDNNHWVPNGTLYPNTMTMTAVVEGAIDENYEIAAFVNGEVRGSARPIYVEPMDAYMFFLTIHGDEVEAMTFKCYDLTTGEEYELNNRINYSNDAHLGSVKDPYTLTRGTVGLEEVSSFNIYPNPTTTDREINLATTCDKVEVFNALGVKVAEYQNVDTLDAFETAGIYVIRVTNNGNVKHCRLVVK